MLCLIKNSCALCIWFENSLQRRMNVLSWTSWVGFAITISSITGNETQRIMRFSQKSLRNPWLAGAAPVAPELRSDRTMGKFTVTPLLTAFLSFLLHLCRWEGREEEKQLQFFLFWVICFNTYDCLNMIRELKIHKWLENQICQYLAGVLAAGSWIAASEGLEVESAQKQLSCLFSVQQDCLVFVTTLTVSPTVNTLYQ